MAAATADDFNYRVYGMGFTRSPEDHSDGRNFDDWRDGQGGFRMDWNEKIATPSPCKATCTTKSPAKALQATSYTPPYSQIIDANALLSGGNILGRWKRILSDGNDIQVQVYYDRTNRQTPNFGEIRNTFDIDFLQRLRLPARQEVTWGLGARVDPVDDPWLFPACSSFPTSERTICSPRSCRMRSGWWINACR